MANEIQISAKKILLGLLRLLFYAWLVWIVYQVLLDWLPDVRPKTFGIQTILFMILKEGLIGYLILFTFLYGLKVWRNITTNILLPMATSRAFNYGLIEAVKSESLEKLEQALREHQENGASSWYSIRLTKLINRYIKDGEASSAITLKEEILESDEEKYAGSLVALTWCEIALPLLGFLGTVIGIGAAISELSSAIQDMLADSVISTNLEEVFSSGFKQMALAFDTTFLGLSALIIVGILHTKLRSDISRELAQAREIFDLTTAMMSQSSDAAILASINSKVETLQQVVENIEHLEQKVDENEHRAIRFRDSIISRVEQVIIEDPSFASIKDVLFHPIVPFDLFGQSYLDKLKSQVRANLGDVEWRFDDLQPSIMNNARAIVAIKDGLGDDSFLVFSMDQQDEFQFFKTNNEIDEIYIFDDSRVICRDGETGSLVSLEIGTGNGEKALPSREICREVKPDDAIALIRIDGALRYMHIKNNGFDLSIDLLDLKRLDHQVIHKEPLRDEYLGWWVNSSLTEIITACRDGRNKSWELRMFKPTGTGTKRKQGIQLRDSGTVNVPANIDLRSVVPIGQNKFLLYDKAGDIHYLGAERQIPLALQNRDWSRDSNRVIQPGALGWLASISNQELTMWRLKSGGYLHRYTHNPDRFQVAGVDTASLTTTLDGRFLLCRSITGQNIYAWQFPSYITDDM